MEPFVFNTITEEESLVDLMIHGSWKSRVGSKLGITIHGMDSYNWATIYNSINFTEDKQSNLNLALCYASMKGYIDLVYLFLSKDGDASTNDNLPICSASEQGHFEIVSLLLTNKADVNARDNAPIQVASANGHLCVVKLLLAYEACASANGNAPIYFASMNGHLSVVELLLSHKACASSNDNLPIYRASVNKHFDVVKLLLSHGADPNAVVLEFNEGLRELSELIQSKRDELASTPEFNASSNGYCGTAMVLASREGDLDIVTFLLNNLVRANVNNDLPVYYASVCGHLNIVKLLLSRGADCRAIVPSHSVIELCAADVNSKAIFLATQEGHLEILQFILSNTPQNAYLNSDTFIEAVEVAYIMGHVQILSLLIEFVERPIKVCQDIMWHACKNGYKDIINLVLNLDSDPINHMCINSLMIHAQDYPDIVALLTRYISDDSDDSY
jgi:ankyrin repeat protein